MKMEIKVHQGMSAEGFHVEIRTHQDVIVYKHRYDYGYNASWDKSWDESKPYTTDIIQDLRKKFWVAKDDIRVVAGKNIFRGDLVSEKDVQRFRDNYLSEME